MGLLDKLFSYFSRDMGIDLGTANTVVYARGKGIVMNEPSVVAINQKTGQVLAVGQEAKKMVGRTPGHIVATRPLRQGVISDFEVTEQMLRYFIHKVHKDSHLFAQRPRVVIGIPCGVTEVEKKAVEDAAKNAGARDVYLIEEPMSAAIGSRLPVQEAGGNMLIDIGGGTCEIAVISLGGIVVNRSLRLAGDKLNEDIIRYAQEKFRLLIGERTAEEIKIAIGSAMELEDELEASMRGRDLTTGLPKEIIVSSEEIRESMARSIKTLVETVKSAVDETPPELLADIMQRGIVLAGGGALLRNLDKLIEKETKIQTRITDDPLTAVVRGCGIVLENLDELREVLASAENLEAPR